MATPTLTIYDFDRVSCIFAGIPIDGFGDDEGISIAENTEGFVYKIGADGKVVRSKSLDRSAKVTITLLQTSASNDLLSALHNADRAAPNGIGVAPLFIRDRSGRAVYEAAQAWISKAPAVSFSREATLRVWEITCAELIRVDGGN